MKATVVEKPGKLIVRDVPEPVMGDYDCLCDALYGATCSGTDVHIIHGDTMPFEYAFPTMLGHETIGRVTKAGSKVENFKVGDLVTRVINRPADGLSSNWGGFAERGLVTDHLALKKTGVEIGFSEGINQVLPDNFDPAGSTMIITWRETLSFISRIGVPVRSSVLVIGSGANGLSFANHAANMLASKIVMIGSAKRRKDALRVGVTDYVRYDEEDVVNVVRRRSLEPFDLIIDAVGKKDQLDRVLPLVKPGGVVTIYGVDDFGKVTLTPTSAPGTFTYANYSYNEGEAHANVVKLMQNGLLRPENFCDLENVFPLDEIGRAFDAVRNRQVVKAVVKLSEDPGR